MMNVGPESSLRAYLKPLLACGLALGMSSSALAESLDSRAVDDPFLTELIAPLDDVSIDVAFNLNDREFAGRRPKTARLGGFSDISTGVLPLRDELLAWEAGFARGDIATIAVLVCETCDARANRSDFLQSWLTAGAEQRVFISYARSDLVTAQGLVEAVQSLQLPNQHVLSFEQAQYAGELYATSGRRLALDTRQARRLDSDITEFNYLGKRARRNTDSIFKSSYGRSGQSVARNEPAAFLKESLGDEFTQSTIEEIVVPGGVALGEAARLDGTFAALSFNAGRLNVTDSNNKTWSLPQADLAMLSSLFDFVARSSRTHSDAIVDIDENGRVRISAALRDTDVGFEIMHADTMPFEYIKNLPVTKSVVVDTFIKWFKNGSQLTDFETEFEVRFLSADNMRIAQTRAALVYEYDSQTDVAIYKDAWGREARRLNEKIDYTGLGNSLRKVANYAGWIGLFRKFEEEGVEFLYGRYDFMKIDKEGRNTPARY